MINETNDTTKYATRTTKPYCGGIRFQHSTIGAVETEVTDGQIKYWADAVAGTTIYEAKFAGSKKSAYKNKAGSKFQQSVDNAVSHEFNRARQIINNSEFEDFVIVTNSFEASEHMIQLAIESGFTPNVDVFIVIDGFAIH